MARDSCSQEPGQRAEQRQPRAVEHGACRAPEAPETQAARGGGEHGDGPSEAACGAGCGLQQLGDVWPAPPPNALSALERSRSNTDVPPGVSKGGHACGVGATGGVGAREGCFSLRLLSLPFLIAENLPLTQKEFSLISSPSTSNHQRQTPQRSSC